jgi:hypothetical protein
VIRQAHRAPVSCQCPSYVSASRRADHPGTVRDLDDQDFLPAHLDDSRGHRQRRLRVVGDQRLDPERICPPRLVSRPSPGDGPVVLHADEQGPSAAVRQADHRLNQVAVIQRRTALALELHLIRLALSDKAGNSLGQVFPVARQSRHGSPPFKLSPIYIGISSPS